MKTNLQGGTSPKTLLHLVSLALLLAALGARAASVGAGGYTNAFPSQPAAIDFAGGSVAGGSGDVTDAAGTDAAVATVTAASVNAQLALVTGSPPGAAAAGVYNDTGKNLQLRPSGSKTTLVMATFTNNSGANATSVRLIYSLIQSTIVAEQVEGVRVYYSLTGAASSWTYVPTWSATAAGQVNAEVALSGPWNINSPLYLLFADDNGAASPDTANQIDNFSFAVSGPAPELPVAIASQPQDRTVYESQPATFTVGVNGNAPYTFQWYRGTDPIANATNVSYTLVNAQLADSGALFSVVAANVASNISSTATSSVAVLTVNALPTNCVAAPSGIVGWWPLDGNVLDVVNNHPATLAGVPAYVGGKVGAGLSFNGVSNYVRAPASAALDVGNGNGFTVELWINPAQVTTPMPLIEWFNADQSSLYLWTSVSTSGTSPGALFANINDTARGPHYLRAPAGILQAGIFQHVALTYDKATGIGRLYLNGAKVAEQNLGSFTPKTDWDVCFGARPSPVDFQLYQGLMDEIGIYSRALSGAEIQAIADAGALGKCQPQVAPSIISQPQGLTVPAGTNVAFNVTAAGSAPLTYQWHFNGAPLSNATNGQFALNNVQPAQSGDYTVVVANQIGSVTSQVATLTVTVPSTNCVPVPGGLVGWWPLDGSVSEVVNTNPTTLAGAPSYVSGKVGTGLSFDGVSNYVRAPASAALDVGTGNGFTVELWINPAQVNTQMPLIEWFNAGQSSLYLWMSVPTAGTGPGGLFANINDTAGGPHYLPGPAGMLQAGTFQHVALTYDKVTGIGRLYLNGTNVAQQNLGSFTPRSSWDVYFGARPFAPSFFLYQGLMDEIGIYSRALSGAEIQAIADAGALGKCQPQVPPSIVSQPQGLTVPVGTSATFIVSAVGSSPLAYQWRFNGAPLSGATNSTLALSGVQTNQAGGYSVVISNPYGSVTSSAAVFTVYQILPGTVVAWGNNSSGQTNVPVGLSGVTAIAAGFYHTVALKNNGTVVAWGGNGNGQATIPAGLSGVIAIAAGDVYTVAVKGDGTVTGWGDNGFGQLTIPAGLSGVMAVTAGRGHTVALKNNGTVVAWGRNEWGQASVPAGLSGVIAIAAGDVHTIALKGDGTVAAWGYNGFGEAVVPAGLSGVTAIAAGGYHNVVLKNNGALVSWGLSSAGQTTIPAGLSGVTALAGGSEHSVALKNDGTVVAWGRNTDGQTTIPAGLSGVTAIASGTLSTVALVVVTPTPPGIIIQPQTANMPVGTNVTFYVTLTGSAPFSFQWNKDGSPIPDATNSTLALNKLQLAQSGDYTVNVANQIGSVTSQVATLTVFIQRILALQAQPQSQEGTRVQIPLTLISTGDVAGMTFTINYDTNYLRDLQFSWDPLIQGGFNQQNQNTPGVVSASFVLSENIPGGTQHLATFDFLLRSVPATLDTALTVTLQDASDAQGNTVPVNTTVVQGCSQRILVRRIIGDNNANDRLDVGDATVILRFLALLDPVRAWDITGNDVNQNTSLDSGDVTKVLRAAAGIDPQPPVPPGVSKNRSSQAAPPAQLFQPAGQFILTPDRTNGTPGQQVTVQVRLQNNASPLSGASFTLNYPTNALRLANSSAYRLGSIVPGGTLAQWNVAPSQNNFATQNGRLTLAASSANAWPSSNGVLAEVTFTIQPGAIGQYLWPLTLTGGETTASGFDNHLFPTANASFIGRVPVAGQLASLVRLAGGQFQFSLAGDTGGTYAVDASTDLIGWTPIQTNAVPAGGSLLVQDPAATGQPHRFYRVRSLY